MARRALIAVLLLGLVGGVVVEFLRASDGKADEDGAGMTPRAITPEEIAVVRAALERAPESPGCVALDEGLDHLRVVSRCECGCASVDFAAHDPSNPARPVAHGVAVDAAGATVGVIVWGTADEVTALEIYDMHVQARDLGLPPAASIMSWEDFGRSPSMR